MHDSNNPAIRRKNGERVRITAPDGSEAIVVVRLGRYVVLDFEQLPDGWRASRVIDIRGDSADNS